MNIDNKEIIKKEFNLDSYAIYKVIISILAPDKIEQMILEIKCNPIEAMRLKRTLEKQSSPILKNNIPVSLGFICRNKEDEVCTYTLLNVCGIVHNIPDFEIIDEEE